MKIRIQTLVVLFLTFCFAGSADAHWCHDLWRTTYQIVARPAADTLAVPSSGSADMEVWVQNNMGHPLVDFTIAAEADQFDITMSAPGAGSPGGPVVDGYLMPGERRTYTMTVSRTGASGQLAAEDVRFYVGFGEPGQDAQYGPGNTGVLITDAAGVPPDPSSLDIYAITDQQSLHLTSSAQANWLASPDEGIGNLIEEYCAGRGSWTSGAPASPITTYCPNSTATGVTCPAEADNSASKYDWQHLWAATEVGYRKADLTAAQRTAFTQRLACGWNDPLIAFRGIAAFVTGFLGEDPGFLADVVADTNASAEDVAMAKAALFMIDGSYAGDVGTCAGGASDPHVRVICSAALGYRNNDDSAVRNGVIPEAEWIIPEHGTNLGRGYMAGKILAMLVWNQRGWSSGGLRGIGDDDVTFYGDEVNPKAPANPACGSQGSGLEFVWSPVAQDVNNHPETISEYRVYWGTTSRGSSVRPGDGFTYDHSNQSTIPASQTSFEPPGLDPAEVYYLAVIAVDDSGNESDYSVEVDCQPPSPPTADLSCACSDQGNCELSASVTQLDINCDGSSSSDAADDIEHFYFSLNGGSEVEGHPVDHTHSFPITSAGGYTVQLRVVDATTPTPLSDTDQVSIQVTDTRLSNQAPVVNAGADVSSGCQPLDVIFNSTGTYDDDGDNLTYDWDFDDGSSHGSGAAPSHTFADGGVFDVLLTVTDDNVNGSLSGTAIIPITVTALPAAAPDLSFVEVAGEDSGGLVVAPGERVNFSADRVEDHACGVLGILWDFDDNGATSNEAEAQHVYATAGVYDATLTASWEGLAITPAESDFEITVTDNHPPNTSGATVTPASGTAPLNITMSANGCTDQDGDGLSATWTVAGFELGSSDHEGLLVDHTITTPGEYRVTLWLTDDAAQPLSVSRNFDVTVSEAGEFENDDGTARLVVDCSCANSGALPFFGVALFFFWSLRVRRRGQDSREQS